MTPMTTPMTTPTPTPTPMPTTMPTPTPTPADADADVVAYGMSLLDPLPQNIFFEGFSVKPTVMDIDHYRDPTRFRIHYKHGYNVVERLFSSSDVRGIHGKSFEGQLSFKDLCQRYHNSVVFLSNSGVQVRKAYHNCSKCSRIMRQEKRRGNLCLDCHNSEVVECKNCGIMANRVHVCVSKPKETWRDRKCYVLCTQCDKHIAKNSFKRHVQRAHQPYTFKCKRCPKRFACQSDLNHHMILHSTKHRYACKHCDKTFKWQSHRSKHVKKDHPEVPRKAWAKPISHVFPTLPIVQKQGLQGILAGL